MGLGGVIYANRQKAASISLQDVDFEDTAFPLPVWVSQVETEAILGRKLAEYAGKKSVEAVVERGVSAESVVQDADGVTVTLATPSGTKEQVRTRYVVGCDGAHSVVRHAAGLSFEGDRYPQHFILCDAKVEGGNYEERSISFFMGTQRVMVLFPLKDGYVRIIGQRLDDATHEPTVEEFQAFVDEIAPEGWRVHSPAWLAHFQFHHRGVSSYRAGRLFVAGDAAHIHSPAGGQGMNTGIQDAANLGWKLAAVLGGRAVDPETLLDSYSAERKPVGDHLLHGTDRMFRFMSSMNPIFTMVRNFLVPRVAPWFFSSKERRTRGYRFMSELGIRYRLSPVVGTDEMVKGPVRGGWRAPDGVAARDGEEIWLHELCSPSKHTWLLLSGVDEGGVEESLGDETEGRLKALPGLGDAEFVRIYAKDPKPGGILDKGTLLHQRYGMVEPGYVLVRPDHYITHIGMLKNVSKFIEWYSTGRAAVMKDIVT